LSSGTPCLLKPEIPFHLPGRIRSAGLRKNFLTVGGVTDPDANGWLVAGGQARGAEARNDDRALTAALCPLRRPAGNQKALRTVTKKTRGRHPMPAVFRIDGRARGRICGGSCSDSRAPTPRCLLPRVPGARGRVAGLGAAGRPDSGALRTEPSPRSRGPSVRPESLAWFGLIRVRKCAHRRRERWPIPSTGEARRRVCASKREALGARAAGSGFPTKTRRTARDHSPRVPTRRLPLRRAHPRTGPVRPRPCRCFESPTMQWPRPEVG